MAKYKLKFFLNYGSNTILWAANEAAKEKYDYPIQHDELPISNKLKKEIETTINWYDKSMNTDYPPDSPIWNEEECKKFNNYQKNLYQKISNELGEEYSIIDESNDLHELSINSTHH